MCAHLQNHDWLHDPKNGSLDVLVVGGGIVGAGIARDAAMRGLNVGLIDQQDFSSGTSSRSSRLLHGGIRYLAQARLGLVREANREKTILHRIAPHLADPLAFIFPTRKKSSWSRWKLSLGVKLYDFLCGRRNLGKSQVLGVSQTLELLPSLESKYLTGAVRYYDGLTNDARLTLDTIRSAKSHGASVSNYVRFLDSALKNGVWRCQLECVVSKTRFEVSAKCVINATGPWSHRTPNSQTSLRLTKGVHLVIDRTRLPLPDAVVIAEGDRILFAIPWGERVILGTTDTDYDGPLGSPACTAEDCRYVLDAVNKAFSTTHLNDDDVLCTWAGLRPLVANKRGNPSEVSRRHEITMGHPGWWDVTGGKLTTYRLMAEETINDIVRFLGVSVRPCETARVPLLAKQDTSEVSGILPPGVSQAAVEHYCQHEWAIHLDDVMIRRTSWRYYHFDHLDVAERVAQWMRDSLGWSQGTMNEELHRYRRLVEANELPRPHYSKNGRRSTRQTDVTK